uniref:Odorant receptor n=1 Tax=Histia rhodope TaxID=1453155 RepID=A0A7G4KBU8_9NEOP|nr:odorant receptor [Histia rhodope]
MDRRHDAMPLLKKIKTYFDKEGFDYSKNYINPYEFHSTFYFFMKYFKVIDDEPAPKWANVVQVLIGAVGFTNLCLSILMCAINSVKPFTLPKFIEGGTYIIVVFYGISIHLCSIFNKSGYHCLLRMLRQDFDFICTRGQTYRKKFFENHLIIWKLSIVSIIFTQSIAIGMIAFSIILLSYYMATHEPGDGTSRPLLIPFWIFNLDLNKSPIYEILFNYSHLAQLCYGFTYVFLVQTQIVWIKHIETKADIVIWLLNDLFDNLTYPNTEEEKKVCDTEIKNRMCFIIRQHQSVYTLLESYAAVYRKLLMFEQKLCGPVVCFASYCIVLQLEAGEFNGVLLLLCIGALTLTYIPCYLCTTLSEKIMSVSDECMNIPFWNANPKIIRPYLVLMIRRSLRPLPLKVPGFQPHTLQTFSKSMVSAYSLFNMLRQANVQ